MTAPDDATLRHMARGDGAVSDDATYAPALAAEVLRLRAQIARVRTAWAEYLDAPAACYGVAYQGVCDAMGARLPGCETVGPCGYCDHPERPR